MKLRIWSLCLCGFFASGCASSLATREISSTESAGSAVNNVPNRLATCEGHGIPGRSGGPDLNIRGTFPLDQKDHSGHDFGVGSFPLSPGYSLRIEVGVGQGHTGGEWLLYQVYILHDKMAVGATRGESAESDPGIFKLSHLENVELFNWTLVHGQDNKYPEDMVGEIYQLECRVPVTKE